MDTSWIRGETPQDAEEIKKNLHQNKNLLDKLSSLVYDKLHTNINPSVRDYDNPNWSHLQAHKNGREEALREIISLLDLQPQRKK